MDPMVGSGLKGANHGHQSVPPDEESSNSNVVSLLEVCFLCNRRFLYDLTLDPVVTDQEGRAKEEDILLHMFFEDTSPLEKSLLQCCSFCKALCNSLLEAKAALSSVVDEITTLLRKSKRLPSASAYILSKPRVVHRLFQENGISGVSNANSASYIPIQIQLDSDLQLQSSNSGFPSQFNLENHNHSSSTAQGGNGDVTSPSPVKSSESESSVSTPTTPSSEIVKEKEPERTPTSFSFLSPSTFGKKGGSCSAGKDVNNAGTIKEKVKGHRAASSTVAGSKGVKRNLTFLSPFKQNFNIAASIPTTSFNNSNTTATSTGMRKQINKEGKGKAKPLPKEKKGAGTVMIANSSGRFVLVHQEENARDSMAEDQGHEAETVNSDVRSEGSVAHSPEVVATVTVRSNRSGNGRKPSLQEKSQLSSGTTTDSSPDEESKGRKKFQCDRCPKAFKSGRDYRNHVASHTNERAYSCDICGASYRHKRALKIHVDMHQGQAKYECDHCKKVFTQKIALVRHLPLHTGETVFQCDLCGKGFLHHSSFSHHKLSHSGVKNFKCSICDQLFYCNSHLKRHYRTHTGERPFSCNICSKTFNVRSNLNVHLRTHSKLPAHACPEKDCSEGFRLKHQLVAHVKTKHHKDLILS